MPRGRKKKEKKDLDVNIDTKNVDVKFTRKDGASKLDIDTNIVDINVKKTESGKTVDIKVDENAKGIAKKIGQVLVRVLKKKRG